MPKIIALCGKICSGKTFYANKIKERGNAVILSTDCSIYKIKEQAKIFETFVVVTFLGTGSHFWIGGHIVSNMLYKKERHP